MARIFGAVAIISVIFFTGYAYYDYKKAGFVTRPELRPGEFSFSWVGGFRAIMTGLPDKRPDWVYQGAPMQVPSWLEPVWSYCRAPTEEELRWRGALEIGQIFEAVCEIDVDGTMVVRGLIYSRPNLQ